MVSETEWRVLELTKKQMSVNKIKEISEKRWFTILKNQYIQLFAEKEKIKKPHSIEMNTRYPLLLEFTKKILRKLETNFQ